MLIHAEHLKELGLSQIEALKIAEEEITAKSIGTYEENYLNKYYIDHKAEVEKFCQDLIQIMKEKHHFVDPETLLRSLFGNALPSILSSTLIKQESAQSVAKDIHDSIINGTSAFPDNIFTPRYQNQIFPPNGPIKKLFWGKRRPTQGQVILTWAIFVVLALCFYAIPQLLPFLDQITFVPSEKWRHICKPVVWILTLLSLYWLVFKSKTAQLRFNQNKSWSKYITAPLTPLLIWVFFYISLTLGVGKALNNFTGSPFAIVAEVTLTKKSSNESCVQLTDKNASFFQKDICLSPTDYSKILPLTQNGQTTTLLISVLQSDYGYAIDGYFPPSIGAK